MPRGEKLRSWVFQPYIQGKGPIYILTLYEPPPPLDRDSAGRWGVGYTLERKEGGKKMLLFDSDTNGIAYAHLSVDSDERAHDVMGWLTLKPGDTDEEFFNKYTPEQREWAESEAEELGYTVMSRWECSGCGRFSPRGRRCRGCLSFAKKEKANESRR